MTCDINEKLPCGFYGDCQLTTTNSIQSYECICDSYFSGDQCQIHTASHDLGPGYLAVRGILTSIYIISFLVVLSQILFKLRTQKQMQMNMSSILSNKSIYPNDVYLYFFFREFSCFNFTRMNFFSGFLRAFPQFSIIFEIYFIIV